MQKIKFSTLSGMLLVFISCVILSGCATTSNNNCDTTSSPRQCTKIDAKHYQAKGVASWYGKKFHRKRTSSGERFNMYGMTAAHKTLPLSSYVLVTNLQNGKQVVVKVNDRGPFIRGRLIDVSYAAAKKLGMLGMGTAPVSIKTVEHA